MPQVLEKIYGYLVQYGLNVLGAIVILIVGKWIARICSRLVEKAMVKSKVNKTLAVFTKNIVYFGVLVFVALAALNKLGIETTSFIAVLGAAGLAVGLALQGSLSNFAAGVMLVVFQPFGVGDYIEAGGATGTVDEIQIFSTIMSTQDKKKIIIPNSKITADKIVIYPNSQKKG